jgi:sporulation protein YlmC with PRC-barrel domain
MKIDVGAHVRTRDGRHVGEVHRVVVDLDDQAVTAIVVLRGRWLSRDVLVPLDFIDHADGREIVLRLDDDQLDQLPDFAYNEILAPPPTWTLAPLYPDGAAVIPIRQRKRLGRRQVDITPGTRVRGLDGDLGKVDEVELDGTTGELDAFWIREGGVFAHDIRIPVEWIEGADESGISLAASKVDIETGLGPPTPTISSGPG